MASKQLGKLRQWAGEVISSRDKSTVTDEFRELENDVELRKEGLLRLHVASNAYHHTLSKKKDSDALDDTEKLLPIDALGVVMITHGEEFGEDSAFGTSLVKFGQAHSKIATLQEAYALTFQDTFLASIKKFGENIKDYEHQRRKLESRRLSYDAAITKLDKVKSSKKEKEKEKKEAEDELQNARLRYEETSEDVRARAQAIQDNEIDQLRELTSFLDIEVNFVQQYLEVLQDVKSSWIDEETLMRVEVQRGNGPTHKFSRSLDSAISEPTLSRKSSKSGWGRSNTAEESEQSSDDESFRTASRKSIQRRPSASGSRPSSRPSSRPTSRASRKRSDSGATAGGTDKEKEKEKNDKAGRRLSMAGWASSAVSSVTGRGKKDKENFATLTDEEKSNSDEKDNNRPPGSTSFLSRKHSRTKSKESVAKTSPKIPTRIIKPPSRQEKKLVRALYDFSGSSDELTFKAGDQILVVNEVLDGWWMGELDGHKGLFPTPYTEVVLSSPIKPPLPLRSGGGGSSLSSQDGPIRQSTSDVNSYVTSDVDDDHPFGDHLLAAGRSPMYGQFDADSITDSAVEEEEEKHLMPTKKHVEDDEYGPKSPDILSSHPPITTRHSTPDISATLVAPGKKAPPPPPPRRSTNNLLGPAPPIPQRRPSAIRSQSSGSLPTLNQTPSSSVSSFGQDVSPFDSATEVSTTDCQNFRQNPFKPHGMCSNCLQVHR